jgi:hypothetical protein
MASDLGQEVIRKVVDVLKNEALIMGPDHMLVLGRGASFIQTPVGCIKQVQHADFDIQDLHVTSQRAKPCSIWVALQDHSGLYINGRLIHAQAGDVIVFSGDCLHNGAESLTQNANFRLFAYVPTRFHEVPWNNKTANARALTRKEVSEKSLHVVTNPLNTRGFEEDQFPKFLFDPATSKFYSFSMPLWLNGLATNDANPDAYPGLPEPGVYCPHFSPTLFNARERAKLSNFRRLCTHCKKGNKLNRRKRVREDDDGGKSKK